MFLPHLAEVFLQAVHGDVVDDVPRPDEERVAVPLQQPEVVADGGVAGEHIMLHGLCGREITVSEMRMAGGIGENAKKNDKYLSSLNATHPYYLNA